MCGTYPGCTEWCFEDALTQQNPTPPFDFDTNLNSDALDFDGKHINKQEFISKHKGHPPYKRENMDEIWRFNTDTSMQQLGDFKWIVI